MEGRTLPLFRHRLSQPRPRAEAEQAPGNHFPLWARAALFLVLAQVVLIAISSSWSSSRGEDGGGNIPIIGHLTASRIGSFAHDFIWGTSSAPSSTFSTGTVVKTAAPLPQDFRGPQPDVVRLPQASRKPKRPSPSPSPSRAASPSSSYPSSPTASTTPSTLLSGASASPTSAEWCIPSTGNGCKRKLRVALLFSGLPRLISGIAHDALRRCVLDRDFEVDTYAHMWWEPSPNSSEPNPIDEFRLLYNPVAVATEPVIPPEGLLRGREYTHAYGYASLGLGNKQWYNFLSLYAGMGRVYKLFHNVSTALGRTYDFVIRTRTDSVWGACPDLAKLDTNLMYAPDWYPGIPNLVNHILVFPGRDATQNGSIAHTMFNMIDKVYDLYDAGIFGVDESLMFALMDLSGFKPRARFISVTQYDPGLTRDGRTLIGATYNEISMPGLVPEPPGGYRVSITTASYTMCPNYRPDFVPEWKK
jgi:hypothetical protein